MQSTVRGFTLIEAVIVITLYGRGSELHCIETRAQRGSEVQRTLLASAARSVGAGTTAAQLDALCQRGG